ncbi:MAG: cysteine peptidase family C39 domain-containing protein, partial [Candidatus Omnitrophota bacterium]
MSRDITVHRTYPLSLNQEKLQELHEWMLDPARKLVTCGAMSLAGLFKLMGRRISPLEVAHYALLIDIISDSLDIYTYNSAKKLESSLYALAKTSALLGVELKPFYWSNFDLDSKEIAKALNKLIPFIAFVDDDHMVLVKGLSKGAIIIEDNDKEITLTKHEFQRRFSGYGLVRANASVENLLKLEFLEEEVAKAVRGTKRDYSNTYDFSDFFKEPDSSDEWLSLGIMVLSAVGGGLLGGASAMGMTMNLGSTMATANTASAMTYAAQKYFGWNPEASMVFGSAVAGASGSFGGLVSGGSFKQFASDFATGATTGAGQGLTNLALYQYLQNNNNFLSKALAPAVFNFAGFVTTEGVNAVWKGALGTGKGSIMDNLGRAVKEYAPQFKNRLAVGIAEQAAIKYKILGKNTEQYANTIGQLVGDFVAPTGQQSGIKDILLRAGASVAISALGGKYNSETGKNKWGMTPTQMAAVSYAGSEIFRAAMDKGPFIDSLLYGNLNTTTGKRDGSAGGGFKKMSEALWTYGGSIPDTKNPAAWSPLQRWNYVSVLLDVSGLSKYKEAVDHAEKQSGKSWRELLKDGSLGSLAFRPVDNWLVSYVTSSLHSAAAVNLGLSAGKVIDAFHGGNSINSLMTAKPDVYTPETIQAAMRSEGSNFDAWVNTQLNQLTDAEWEKVSWLDKPMGAPGTITAAVLGKSSGSSVMGWATKGLGEKGTLTGLLWNLPVNVVNAVTGSELGGIILQSKDKPSLAQNIFFTKDSKSPLSFSPVYNSEAMRYGTIETDHLARFAKEKFGSDSQKSIDMYVASELARLELGTDAFLIKHYTGSGGHDLLNIATKLGSSEGGKIDWSKRGLTEDQASEYADTLHGIQGVLGTAEAQMKVFDNSILTKGIITEKQRNAFSAGGVSIQTPNMMKVIESGGFININNRKFSLAGISEIKDTLNLKKETSASGVPAQAEALKPTLSSSPLVVSNYASLVGPKTTTPASTAEQLPANTPALPAAAPTSPENLPTTNTDTFLAVIVPLSDGSGREKVVVRSSSGEIPAPLALKQALLIFEDAGGKINNFENGHRAIIIPDHLKSLVSPNSAVPDEVTSSDVTPITPVLPASADSRPPVAAQLPVQTPTQTPAQTAEPLKPAAADGVQYKAPEFTPATLTGFSGFKSPYAPQREYRPEVTTTYTNQNGIITQTVERGSGANKQLVTSRVADLKQNTITITGREPMGDGTFLNPFTASTTTIKSPIQVEGQYNFTWDENNAISAQHFDLSDVTAGATVMAGKTIEKWEGKGIDSQTKQLLQPGASLKVSNGTGMTSTKALHSYDMSALDPKATDVVKEIQNDLKNKGFYMGEVTGNLDDATRTAITAFNQMPLQQRIASVSTIDNANVTTITSQIPTAKPQAPIKERTVFTYDPADPTRTRIQSVSKESSLSERGTVMIADNSSGSGIVLDPTGSIQLKHATVYSFDPTNPQAMNPAAVYVDNLPTEQYGYDDNMQNLLSTRTNEYKLADREKAMKGADLKEISPVRSAITQYGALERVDPNSLAGMSKDKIRELQGNLQSLGLYTDKIDGIAGKNTRQAVEQLNAQLATDSGPRAIALHEIAYNESGEAISDKVSTLPFQGKPQWAQTRAIDANGIITISSPGEKGKIETLVSHDDYSNDGLDASLGAGDLFDDNQGRTLKYVKDDNGKTGFAPERGWFDNTRYAGGSVAAIKLDGSDGTKRVLTPVKGQKDLWQVDGTNERWQAQKGPDGNTSFSRIGGKSSTGDPTVFLTRVADAANLPKTLPQAERLKQAALLYESGIVRVFDNSDAIYFGDPASGTYSSSKDKGIYQINKTETGDQFQILRLDTTQVAGGADRPLKDILVQTGQHMRDSSSYKDNTTWGSGLGNLVGGAVKYLGGAGSMITSVIIDPLNQINALLGGDPNYFRGGSQDAVNLRSEGWAQVKRGTGEGLVALGTSTKEEWKVVAPFVALAAPTWFMVGAGTSLALSDEGIGAISLVTAPIIDPLNQVNALSGGDPNYFRGGSQDFQALFTVGENRIAHNQEAFDNIIVNGTVTGAFGIVSRGIGLLSGLASTSGAGGSAGSSWFMNPANSSIIKEAAKRGVPGAEWLLKQAVNPEVATATGVALSTGIGAAGGGGIYTAYTVSSGNEFKFSDLAASMFAGASVASSPYILRALGSPAVVRPLAVWQTEGGLTLATAARNLAVSSTAVAGTGTVMADLGARVFNGGEGLSWNQRLAVFSTLFAANTLRSLSGAAADAVVANHSSKLLATAGSALNYGVQLGTVGGSWGVIAQQWRTGYDGDKTFWQNHTDNAATFYQSGKTPFIVGALAGLPLAAKGLFPTAFAKDTLLGRVASAYSPNTLISYLTWPTTAVAARGVYGYLSGDPNNYMSWKDAIDIATFATFARFLSGPSKAAQYFTNKTPWITSSSSLNSTLASPVARYALLGGTGAAVNIGKELGVGLFESSTDIGLDKPLYVQRNELGRVTGWSTTAKDGYKFESNGLWFGEDNFGGKLRAAAFRGAFWATLTSLAVKDAKNIFSSLETKYGSQTVKAAAGGRSAGIIDSLKITGAERLGLTGAWGGLKWISIGTQFPVYAGMYKSAVYGLETGLLPNGTLLNLELPTRDFTLTEQEKAIGLTRIFDEHGWGVRPAAQSVLRSAAIDSPESGVILNPLIAGTMLARERTTASNPLSVRFRDFSQATPVRRALVAEPIGLARVALVVTGVDTAMEWASTKRLQLVGVGGGDSKVDYTRGQVWVDKDGRPFAAPLEMDYSGEGASKITGDTASITLRESFSTGFGTKLGGLSETSIGSWGTLILALKPMPTMNREEIVFQNGQKQMAGGNLQEANKLFGQAEGIARENGNKNFEQQARQTRAENLRVMAGEAFGRGNLAEAEGHLITATSIDQNNSLGFIDLGIVQNGLGKYSDANVSFKRGERIAQAQSLPEAASQIRDLRVQNIKGHLTQEGIAQYRAGNMDRGEVLLNRAFTVSGRNDGNLLALMGDMSFSQGDISKAKNYYTTALQLKGGKDAGIQNALGELYRQQGNVTLAKAHFKSAYDLSRGTEYFSNLGLGSVYLGEGRMDRALPYLETAAGLGGKQDIGLLKTVGSIYDAQGNFGAAKSYYTTALGLAEGRDIDLHRSLQSIYQQEGNNFGARAHEMRARELSRISNAPLVFEQTAPLETIGEVRGLADQIVKFANMMDKERYLRRENAKPTGGINDQVLNNQLANRIRTLSENRLAELSTVSDINALKPGDILLNENTGQVLIVSEKTDKHFTVACALRENAMAALQPINIFDQAILNGQFKKVAMLEKPQPNKTLGVDRNGIPFGGALPLPHPEFNRAKEANERYSREQDFQKKGSVFTGEANRATGPPELRRQAFIPAFSDSIKTGTPDLTSRTFRNNEIEARKFYDKTFSLMANEKDGYSEGIARLQKDAAVILVSPNGAYRGPLTNLANAGGKTFVAINAQLYMAKEGWNGFIFTANETMTKQYASNQVPSGFKHSLRDFVKLPEVAKAIGAKQGSLDLVNLDAEIQKLHDFRKTGQTDSAKQQARHIAGLLSNRDLIKVISKTNRGFLDLTAESYYAEGVPELERALKNLKDPTQKTSIMVDEVDTVGLENTHYTQSDKDTTLRNASQAFKNTASLTQKVFEIARPMVTSGEFVMADHLDPVQDSKTLSFSELARQDKLAGYRDGMQGNANITEGKILLSPAVLSRFKGITDNEGLIQGVFEAITGVFGARDGLTKLGTTASEKPRLVSAVDQGIASPDLIQSNFSKVVASTLEYNARNNDKLDIMDIKLTTQTSRRAFSLEQFSGARVAGITATPRSSISTLAAKLGLEFKPTEDIVADNNILSDKRPGNIKFLVTNDIDANSLKNRIQASLDDGRRVVIIAPEADTVLRLSKELSKTEFKDRVEVFNNKDTDYFRAMPQMGRTPRSILLAGAEVGRGFDFMDNPDIIIAGGERVPAEEMLHWTRRTDRNQGIYQQRERDGQRQGQVVVLLQRDNLRNIFNQGGAKVKELQASGISKDLFKGIEFNKIDVKDALRKIDQAFESKDLAKIEEAQDVAHNLWKQTAQYAEVVKVSQSADRAIITQFHETRMSNPLQYYRRLWEKAGDLAFVEHIINQEQQGRYSDVPRLNDALLSPQERVRLLSESSWKQTLKMWTDFKDLKVNGKDLSPEGMALVEGELRFAERMMKREMSMLNSYKAEPDNWNAWRSEVRRAPDFVRPDGKIDVEAFARANQRTYDNMFIIARNLGEHIIPSRVIENHLVNASTRIIGQAAEKVMPEYRTDTEKPKIPAQVPDYMARMDKAMETVKINPAEYAQRRQKVEAWLGAKGVSSDGVLMPGLARGVSALMKANQAEYKDIASGLTQIQPVASVNISSLPSTGGQKLSMLEATEFMMGLMDFEILTVGDINSGMSGGLDILQNLGTGPAVLANYVSTNIHADNGQPIVLNKFTSNEFSDYKIAYLTDNRDKMLQSVINLLPTNQPSLEGVRVALETIRKDRTDARVAFVSKQMEPSSYEYKQGWMKANSVTAGQLFDLSSSLNIPTQQGIHNDVIRLLGVFSPVTSFNQQSWERYAEDLNRMYHNVNQGINDRLARSLTIAAFGQDMIWSSIIHDVDLKEPINSPVFKKALTAAQNKRNGYLDSPLMFPVFTAGFSMPKQYDQNRPFKKSDLDAERGSKRALFELMVGRPLTSNQYKNIMHVYNAIDTAVGESRIPKIRSSIEKMPVAVLLAGDISNTYRYLVGVIDDKESKASKALTAALQAKLTHLDMLSDNLDKRDNLLSIGDVQSIINQYGVDERLFGLHPNRAQERNELLNRGRVVSAMESKADFTAQQIKEASIDRIVIDALLLPNAKIRKASFDADRDLVYPIVINEARRQLTNILKEMGGIEDLASMSDALFSVRTSTSWAEGFKVPAIVKEKYNSPKELWFDAGSRVVDNLNHQMTNTEIQTHFEDYFGEKVDLAVNYDRVRRSVQGIQVGFPKLATSLKDVHAPRLREEFNAVNNDLFKIQTAPVFVRPGEMVRSGAAISESTSLADDSYGFMVNLRSFKPVTGSTKRYQDVFDMPHELYHIFTDRLTTLDQTTLKSLYEVRGLDDIYGQGATQELISPEGILKHDLTFGGNHTMNEMLATMAGLRYVAKNYTNTKDPEALWLIKNLTNRESSDLPLHLLKDMPYQDLKNDIESARGDLKVTSGPKRMTSTLPNLDGIEPLQVNRDILASLQSIGDAGQLEALGATLPVVKNAVEIFDILKSNLPGLEFSWYGSGVTNLTLNLPFTNDYYHIGIVGNKDIDLEKLKEKIDDFTQKTTEGKIKNLKYGEEGFEYKGIPFKVIGTINQENLIIPFDKEIPEINLSINALGITSNGRFLSNKVALDDLNQGTFRFVAGQGVDIAKNASWINNIHRALRTRLQTGFDWSEETKNIVANHDYYLSLMPSISEAKEADLDQLTNLKLSGKVKYTTALASGFDGTLHRLYRDAINPEIVTRDLEALGIKEFLAPYVDFANLEQQAQALKAPGSASSSLVDMDLPAGPIAIAPLQQIGKIEPLKMADIVSSRLPTPNARAPTISGTTISSPSRRTLDDYVQDLESRNSFQSFPANQRMHKYIET